MRQSIQSLPLSDDVSALVLALTLGDRSSISPDLWDKLALSGVIHLVVISGLHIGLVAMLSYSVGAVLARLMSLLGRPVTARYWGSALSLIVAVLYSALAGFSLPTQRALIMVVVAIIILLLNRQVNRGLGFGVALAGVALLDPLAVYSAGFWLSFGAVAGLLWLVPKTLNRSYGWKFFKIQWLVFAVLLLPLMVCYLPVAWLSPLVNALAIPWISFLVVPLCLLASVAFPVSTTISSWLWGVAGWQLDLFIMMIEAVPSLDVLPAIFTMATNECCILYTGFGNGSVFITARYTGTVSLLAIGFGPHVFAFRTATPFGCLCARCGTGTVCCSPNPSPHVGLRYGKQY